MTKIKLSFHFKVLDRRFLKKCVGISRVQDVIIASVRSEEVYVGKTFSVCSFVCFLIRKIVGKTVCKSLLGSSEVFCYYL